MQALLSLYIAIAAVLRATKSLGSSSFIRGCSRRQVLVCETCYGRYVLDSSVRGSWIFQWLESR